MSVFPHVHTGADEGLSEAVEPSQLCHADVLPGAHQHVQRSPGPETKGDAAGQEEVRGWPRQAGQYAQRGQQDATDPGSSSAEVAGSCEGRGGYVPGRAAAERGSK